MTKLQKCYDEKAPVSYEEEGSDLFIFFFFSVAAMAYIRLCVHLPSTIVTGFARKSSSVLKYVVKFKTRLSLPPILVMWDILRLTGISGLAKFLYGII